MPTERPLIIDAGIVRETTTEDSVPASVFWGRVKNDSGGTLTKGTPVYQISAVAFTPTVAAANAASAATMPAIGLLWETLADQAEGAVLYLGLLKDINTNSFNVGDAIYVASGGGLTATPPSGTGELVQFIGFVTRKDATNGALQILGTGREDIYPAAGIPVSTGNGWSTSKTTPTGALVGTTDSQTLTTKTISVDSNTISGIAASSFVLSDASGYIDGAAAQKAIPSGTVVGTSDTQTLTNKRIDPRVSSTASITSPLAPNSDSYDQYAATAQTTDFTINADSGTPVNGQKILFRFKDSGSTRAITWTTGSSKAYRAIGVTLPTATTANKTVYVGCIYNAADDRWDAVAVTTEA